MGFGIWAAAWSGAGQGCLASPGSVTTGPLATTIYESEPRTTQPTARTRRRTVRKRQPGSRSVRSWLHGSFFSDYSSSGISEPSPLHVRSTTNARPGRQWAVWLISICSSSRAQDSTHGQPAAGLPYKRLGALLCCGSGEFQGESSGSWRGMPMQTTSCFKDNHGTGGTAPFEFP